MNEYRIIIEKRIKNDNYCAKIQKKSEENEDWKTVKYAHHEKWKICMSRAVKKLDKAINEEQYIDNAYKWHMKWKEEFEKYKLN